MKKILFGLLGILFAFPVWALPAGYTELQYIESTGTQYIDTGVGLNSVNKITGKIAFTNLDGSLSYIAGGRRSDNVAVGYALFSAAHGGFSIYNTTWPDQGVNISINQILEFETFMGSEQQSFIVNGNTILTGDKSISLDSRNVCLFGLGSEYLALAKMYSLKMYNNNTLVRDFIPARRDDGVLGMYDTVGGRFYINAGSGSFAAGPIACDGTIVNYTSATGTVSQSGTPTPTNPITPTFYTQGDMVLRRVGDYADTYDATTGKITRKVGVLVLTGNETWSKYSDSNPNNIGTFYTSLSPEGIDINGAPGLSTHFPVGAGSANSVTRQELLLTKTVIYVRTNKSEISDATQLNQWLAEQYAAGTPVTIYYSLATEVEETVPASYCQQAIKVATTKYVESQFGGLSASLAAAVNTVNTVVTNTITQAASIATLQSGKQTRPADDTCPAYKQCLLVEDEQGVPHWYEITDPFRDFVAPIIANNVAPASTTAQPGYTQLEYIESTGEQWIDTGVFGTDGSSFEIRLSYSGLSGPYQMNGWASDAQIGIDSGAYWWNRSRGRTTVTSNTIYNAKLVISGSESKLYVNENLENEVSLGYTHNNTGFGLFAVVGGAYPSKEKVYNFVAKDSAGRVIGNFIPAKRNSDNAIGMYDTVSRTFFTNSGTGTFTAGPVVANTDVPANPTWTATWAANATTGVTAGTVYGEGLCNASTSDATPITDSGWNTAGPRCWCKMVGLESDGAYNNTTDEKWAFADSLGGGCTTNCASACLTRLNSTPGFRSALFGM